MSNLWLTVEVAAGADIGGTCDEAVTLATKTGLTIWFKFNGVKCLARSGDNPRGIEADWHKQIGMIGGDYRIASDKSGSLESRVGQLFTTEKFMAITKSMINEDVMLRILMEKMNAEMMAAAEPVIKKAAEDAEKEMRKRLGAMFVALLEGEFSVERNQNELRILVKHEVSN